VTTADVPVVIVISDGNKTKMLRPRPKF